MNFLEEKIKEDGIIKEGNILKVDNFLNHQIDVDIIRQIAYELKRRFRGKQVNKILTIEASGIAIAMLLGDLYDVPVVFAKRARQPIPPTINMCRRHTRSPISATTMCSCRAPISLPTTKCSSLTISLPMDKHVLPLSTLSSRQAARW